MVFNERVFFGVFGSINNRGGNKVIDNDFFFYLGLGSTLPINYKEQQTQEESHQQKKMETKIHQTIVNIIIE